MHPQRLASLFSSGTLCVSRRAALRRLVAGSGAALVAGHGLARAAAQEATPEAGQCVATAPPTEDGVGFATLLVGGIVHDMPAGPVEIRISRFTLEPGTPFPASPLPYPALMYIETGASDCPGGAGRIVYDADGAILDETTGDGVQHIPARTTQYIPAGVPDGAGNEGSELMSSIVIEFVPVADGGTPGAGT
jgi:hypothetical protein